ncbi:MAG: peptide ABC transporter substrate-binding protein, partial [Sciscionella sp.]
MKFRPRTALLALPVAVALLVSGCTGGGSGSGESAGAANSNGTVTFEGSEPQNTDFLPANSVEQGGAYVADNIYAGLVAYNPDTAKPYNLMAKSIKTTDSKVYDITIKKGWKFHDGTEVKAKNYVDAWNYAAYGPNAQLAANFFSQIQGYDAVHPADPKAKPTAKTMSGLKVLGDDEFQVTLKAPFSVFPTKIGYVAFDPLPDAFFNDPAKFKKHPIGDGPVKFVSFTPNQSIKMTRFDGYKGSNAVHVKNINIRIYTNLEAAYADLKAGNLDFMDQFPPSALVGNTYKKDLGDHVLKATLIGVDTIAVPEYLPEYKNIDLRRAISMAIDRQSITSKVLSNAYVPANGYLPSDLDGYKADQCQYCTYNPALAKQMFAKSGFNGKKLTITSNSDGGHAEAMTGICNSIQNVLGVECDYIPATSFGSFRQTVVAKQATGMLRSDWSADYPSIEDFVNPLYKT